MSTAAPVRAPGTPAGWLLPALAVGAALAAVLTLPVVELSLASASVLMLVTAVLTIGLLVRRAPGGIWAVTTILAVVIAVFHVGMALFPLLGLSPAIEGEEVPWFYSALMPRAMWLVAVALLAYALGVCLVRPRRQQVPERGAAWVTTAAGRSTATLGMMLVVGCVLLWVALTAQALGATFFLASYRQYLDGTASLPFDYVLFFLGLGMVLVAAGDSRPHTMTALTAFAVFAVVAFPIGLRGEVLFPLAAYAGIRARRHPMPGAGWVVLAAVALLVLIGVAKDVRQVGLDEAGQVTTSANPLAGLGELGGTIRTVHMSLEWHETLGEPYRDGATYWGPVDRLAHQALGVPQPEAGNDWRLMNVEISAREGPIGGSVIAEAHHNFGLAGVVGVPFLLGLLIALLERRPARLYGDLLLGVLLLSLLNHVRNAFTPVPFELAVGATLVVVLFVWHSDPRRLRRILAGAGPPAPVPVRGRGRVG